MLDSLKFTHEAMPPGDIAGLGEGAHGRRVLGVDLGNDFSDRWIPCLNPCVSCANEPRSKSLPVPARVHEYGDRRGVSADVISYDTHFPNIVLAHQHVSIGVVQC